MTITDFENKLNEILTNTLSESVEIDDLGNTVPANEYRAEQLSTLSREIRRCAWEGPATKLASNLAARADQASAQMRGTSHVEPLPRFDAIVSGGIIHRAIK